MSSRGTMESLAREIPKTIDQGEKLMSDTIEKGRKIFSQAVENSEQAVEEVYGQAKDTVEAAVDSTSAMVKKYPLQSLLIGFGVGLLAGFVFKASRSQR